MLELEEAIERILAAIPPATPEVVGLEEACGRFAVERVVAPLDLPAFDNSSMDGYAVRGADTTDATADHPARLRVIGRVAAGASFPDTVKAGECVRLFTGSPMPAGADAVIMQEDTTTDPHEPNTMAALTGVQPGENVRRQGEDVPHGSVILEPGEELTAGRLSLLAALGMDRVATGLRPVVGVLATGSELKDPGRPLTPGQIYESNRVSLSALTRKTGAEARVYPIVCDTLGETRAALLQALADCDILVTSGGVSVGELDFIKNAFEEAGGELQFWKVAVKPGRPFVFGRWQQKLLFGLPGNPVSAFVTFLLLVRPALLRWQGAKDVALPCSIGELSDDLVNEGGRRHFFRVCIDPEGRVHSSGLQASHVLSSLAKANGLVDVPPGATLRGSSKVRVLRWE
ncbi:MAG TPA: gephyrin-like molybdotransferase Glp [Verrucomicrobiae bacterium]